MGLFDKIKQGLSKTKQVFSERMESVLSAFRPVDEDLLDELEEALILADMGAESADEAITELRAQVKAGKIKDSEDVRAALRVILSGMLGENRGLDLSTRPSVILVIGVNGVGKTTTIGKLAHLFKQDGKRVILAAGDTFRAAAADQLEIWSRRSGVEIVRHQEGADPAAVVYDTITAAKARGCDVIICDTAGRLHNKQNLMNELSKISRVIDRELPGASRETLLVLDATTGQNAVSQAREFRNAAGVTGIALTKLDGTAKGGIVIAIAHSLGIPVKYIGLGEGIDDLIPFDPEDFIKAVL